MWYHDLRITFRQLYRQPLISSLVIGGLAISLAAYLLIIGHVLYERSYDHFHTESERIFRVDSEFAAGTGRERFAMNYYGFGEAMTADLPEVETYTTIHQADIVVRKAETSFRENKIYLVDSNFLEIFHFPLLAGERQRALAQPGWAVLSQTAAQKYFGDTNPIGQTLRYNDQGELTIKAVVDVPANGHIQFNILANNTRFVQQRYRDSDDIWNWSNFWVYVRLKSADQVTAVASKMPDLIDRHLPDDTEATSVYLVPIEDIHLHSNLSDEISPNGQAQTVSTLLLVAFGILLIGWINFINLTTAQATEQAKGVGIRKVVGANVGQVRRLYLSRSLLINGVALLFACILLWIGQPWIVDLLGHPLDINQLDPQAIFIYGGVLVLSMLVSGWYLSTLFASLRPMEVLKGQFLGRLSGVWARRGLTVFQFVASLVLIAGTFAVYRQIAFMQTQTLGFSEDKMLIVKGPEFGGDYPSSFLPLREGLTQLSGVSAMTASGTIPSEEYDATLAGVRRAGVSEQEGLLLDFILSDHNFLSTYQIEVLAGRNFQPGQDSSFFTVVLNENAVQKLGFASPADAIGKRIHWGSDDETPQYREIIGVMADYHHQSLVQTKDPIVLLYSPTPGGFYSMRLREGDKQATIAQIAALYEQHFPGNPFEHFFLDEALQAQYSSDLRLGRIILLFGGMAILVACLGLFGLAYFLSIRKMKEIGVRKVLGASFQQIAVLFSREFIGLVGVAILIGLPLAAWLIDVWLANYAYRMPWSLALFVWPACILVVVAIFTISYHTIRSTQVNPAQHLQQE